MAERSNTSEYQPAPPFYRSQGRANQLEGTPTNLVAVTNHPSNMQCSSATRGIDGVGNRINSAGQVIPLNAKLEQKSISIAVNPAGN